MTLPSRALILYALKMVRTQPLIITNLSLAVTLLNGAAETGSVSTSVYIPSDGYVKASYIFLGSNNDASSSGRFTEVVFTSSMIKFRNETGSQVDLASYSKDTWVDVTISNG